MPVTITNERVITTKRYVKTFHFQGNIDGKVKKVVGTRGDGDITTTRGAITYAEVTANLSLNASLQIVRLSVRYGVFEHSFVATKNPKSDYLYFEAHRDYSFRDFFSEGRYTKTDQSGRVKRESTPTIELVGGSDIKEEFFVRDYFRDKKHGYNKVGTKAYASINKLRSWMSIGELSVKIDDGGSELNKMGNLGVKGQISFSLRRTDNIKVTTVTDDTSSCPMLPPKKGNEQRVSSFPSTVDAVLCRGYDICGNYADSNSCRDRVLDYKRLNEYNRIKRNSNSESHSEIFSGEGLQEYTSSIEKSLNVKVAASAFGASFSNETSRSFKQDTFKRAGYKYLTQRDVYSKEAYTVQGYNVPRDLTGFLTPEFLTDLNRLTAREIVNKYGTHVVIGMKLGTNFSYNMLYRESTSKMSTATTFKSSTSVAYNNDGTVKKDKPTQEKSIAERAAEKLVDGELDCKAMNAIVEYLKVAQKTTPQQAASNHAQGKGSASGISASMSVAYSESVANSLLQEDKSMQITCFGHGGDTRLLSLISRNNDLSRYEEWVRSSNDSNLCFADFVPGTLIPLHEIIPNGYKLSANQIKTASEQYQAEHSKSRITPIKGWYYQPFRAYGKSNTRAVQSDAEIHTSAGKATAWKVHIELLNFDNGTCGYAMTFTVKEGGRAGSQSILLTTITVPIPLSKDCSSMAIDTSLLNNISIFEAEREDIGKIHGWYEVTNYLKTTGASHIIDCDGALVHVQIDGSGDDLDHVGIKGWIKIPWLGY